MIFDCECTECVWYENEECNAPGILITNGGVCDSYEQREEDEYEED